MEGKRVDLDCFFYFLTSVFIGKVVIKDKNVEGCELYLSFLGNNNICFGIIDSGSKLIQFNKSKYISGVVLSSTLQQQVPLVFQARKSNYIFQGSINLRNICVNSAENNESEPFDGKILLMSSGGRCALEIYYKGSVSIGEGGSIEEVTFKAHKFNPKKSTTPLKLTDATTVSNQTENAVLRLNYIVDKILGKQNQVAKTNDRLFPELQPNDTDYAPSPTPSAPRTKPQDMDKERKPKKAKPFRCSLPENNIPGYKRFHYKPPPPPLEPEKKPRRPTNRTQKKPKKIDKPDEDKHVTFVKQENQEQQAEENKEQQPEEAPKVVEEKIDKKTEPESPKPEPEPVSTPVNPEPTPAPAQPVPEPVQAQPKPKKEKKKKEKKPAQDDSDIDGILSGSGSDAISSSSSSDEKPIPIKDTTVVAVTPPYETPKADIAPPPIEIPKVETKKDDSIISGLSDSDSEKPVKIPSDKPASKEPVSTATDVSKGNNSTLSIDLSGSIKTGDSVLSDIDSDDSILKDSIKDNKKSKIVPEKAIDTKPVTKDEPKKEEAKAKSSDSSDSNSVLSDGFF